MQSIVRMPFVDVDLDDIVKNKEKYSACMACVLR